MYTYLYWTWLPCTNFFKVIPVVFVFLSVLGVYSLASVSGSARLFPNFLKTFLNKIIVRTLLFYAIQVCESVKKSLLFHREVHKISSRGCLGIPPLASILMNLLAFNLPISLSKGNSILSLILFLEGLWLVL